MNSSSSGNIRARRRLWEAIEPLEARRMLTVSFDSVTHVLTVTGTSGPDTIVFSQATLPDGTRGPVHVVVNSVEDTPAGFSDVAQINVDAQGDNDTINLDGIVVSANVSAGPGNDTMTSGQGDDKLAGGDGDDRYVFHDNWGSDVIDESSGIGSGADTMDFSACADNLLVNLGALLVTDLENPHNIANHGSRNVENVITGSGDDIFHLLAGLGGTGGTVDGGTGTNTLDYSSYGTAVNVNLASGSATDIAGGGAASVTNISNVNGGSGDDTIVGNASSNVISGGPGTNTLSGGGGSDSFVFNPAGHDTVSEPAGASFSYDFSSFTVPLTVIVGTTGVNIFGGGALIASGGSGLSKVIGGRGNDIFAFQNGARFGGSLDGGAGTNTLSYAAYKTAVRVDLRSATATGTTGVSHFSNVYGGAANDLLVGDDNANSIFGLAGKDKIYGLGGNDNLDGGTGDDMIKGGDGNDNITGGNGNDRLYGESGADRIKAGSGNDTIDGGKGSDKLYGDSGNDVIYARDKTRDSVYGGSGKDQARIDRGKDKVFQIESFIA